MRIEVTQGDITAEGVDAIVNAAVATIRATPCEVELVRLVAFDAETRLLYAAELGQPA